MAVKILVTGHRGYIGSVMTQTLLKQNFRVSGVDTNYFRSKPLSRRGVTEQIKDIRDISPSDLKGFYAVVHLSAIADDSSSQIVPESTLDINVSATLRLAAMAKNAGVERFLFSSTCGIYGSASEGMLCTETAPALPNSPYTISKLEAEMKLADMANSAFAPVFMRNATVFGWSPRNRFDSAVNNIIFLAATKGRVSLRTDGLAWRPVLHVRDVARAFLSVLEAPKEKVWNVTFNVGDNNLNFRLVDIANAACAAIPEGSVETAKGKSAASSYSCDFSKIRSEIGFRAKWSLVHGMKDMIGKIWGSGNYDDIFHYNDRAMRYLLSSGEIDSRFRWIKDILAAASD